MTKTRIFVTGSNGQLGNELKKISNEYNSFEFLFHDIDTIDITSLKSLQEFCQKNELQYIINCAAYTAVDKAENDKELAILVNDKAVSNLAKISVDFGIRLIHISTDYVFDGTSCRPYKENDSTNPVSVYGSSKLNGESHLTSLENSIVIRTAWLYSTFGNNFVKTMLRLGKEKEQLNVVFDQVGTPTNAADLAETILKIIHKVETNTHKFIPGIYHYSNEGVCSWFDFACEIMLQANLSCKVLPIETYQYPTPAIRPAYSVFNKAKIKKDYDIQIPWWKDSLQKCVSSLIN